jgi:probable rRNA maturation factor
VSIEVANESGVGVDEPALVSVARYVLDRLGINPLAELSVLLMDVPAMTELHVKWMDEPGPTDVMSFPMDELDTARRPDEGGPGPALLGDVVLCPEVAAEQAVSAGHSLDDELHLLTVHGVLHLLGYDHAEPGTEREMFRLQNELLDAWRDERIRAAQQDRVRAADSRVLDTVGLADGQASPDRRRAAGAGDGSAGGIGADLPAGPGTNPADPTGPARRDGSAHPADHPRLDDDAGAADAGDPDADPAPRERAE